MPFLFTAHLECPTEVIIGQTYMTVPETDRADLRDKRITVVAGPHADYLGPSVYTCEIEECTAADALPFFNKRWASCFESVTLSVVGERFYRST